MVMPPGYDLDLDKLVAQAIRHGTPDRSYKTGEYFELQPLTVMACAQRRLDILEKLIQAGAQNSLPQALGYAVGHNADDCVLLLLRSSVKPDSGDIFAALRHGRWDLVFLLLEYNAELLHTTFPSEREVTLLHLAMLPPDLAATRRLLGLGMEVGARNKNGATPLHCLVEMNPMPSPERLPVLELLLSHEADPNATDNFGMTALMWVASRGDRHAIKLLLDAGADCALVNKDGSRAWQYAERKYPELVSLLLPQPVA
nr:ankyrin repeat domain-containing protein [Armatimonas sp.]